MNSLLLDMPLATLLFALASLGLIYVCLERLLHHIRELARLRSEVEAPVPDSPLHPVLALSPELHGLEPPQRLLRIEEACFRFFEPRIRQGEFLRNLALSGSFGLNLVGFILTTGLVDPGELTRHVAPYFAFSLVGILLGISQSWLLLRLAGAHQEALYFGQRLAESPTASIPNA